MQVIERMRQALAARRAEYPSVVAWMVQRRWYGFPETAPTGGPDGRTGLVRRVLTAMRALGVPVNLDERLLECRQSGWGCTEAHGETTRIHLRRPHNYDDAEHFAQIALHELAHWTGRPERLNRASMRWTFLDVMLGSWKVAVEEMTAELTSLILMDRLGWLTESAFERSLIYLAAYGYGLLGDEEVQEGYAKAAEQAAEAVWWLEGHGFPLLAYGREGWQEGQVHEGQEAALAA